MWTEALDPTRSEPWAAGTLVVRAQDDEEWEDDLDDEDFDDDDDPDDEDWDDDFDDEDWEELEEEFEEEEEEFERFGGGDDEKEW